VGSIRCADRESRSARRSRVALTSLVAVVVILGGGAAAAQFQESPSPSQPSPKQPDEKIVVPPDKQAPETAPSPEPLAPGSAVLTANPAAGTAPLSVVFDGSGSNRSNSYSLAFGDGEVVQGKGTPGTFTHTYTNPSTYTAVLTVFASDESTYTDSVAIQATELTETPSPTTEDEDVAPPGERDTNDPGDTRPGAAAPGEAQPSEEEPLDAETTSAELPGENSERSFFVRSVRDPTELSFTPKFIAESVLLAAVLILLVGFPAEMFNSTLLENYEEISGWFSWSWLQRLRSWLSGWHGAVVVVAFAGVGAIIHSQLEPHFAFDKGGLALLLGLFLVFMIVSLTYDVIRRGHLRKRHDLSSVLRAQLIGMVVASILVLASRIGHFHPGYMYGLFTALAYAAALHESHHGRALAFASIRLLIVAIVAWFLWIPVKHLAEEPDAGFLILTLDAMLAVLWVAGLAAIVFGLAPLRFFYGEQVKAWSFWGWAAIWGTSILMFVYTLLHPERGLFGSSEEASLFSVLALFVGFGLFSVAFWGYFRIRDLRRRSAAQTTT
jgi:hypothetical protein